MLTQRIEFYKNTEINSRPIKTDFACLNCPLASWEYGYTKETINEINEVVITEVKNQYEEFDELDITEFFEEMIDRKIDLILSNKRYNFLSCYCSKKFQYPFDTRENTYNHILSCEFKNTELNNTATQINND